MTFIATRERRPRFSIIIPAHNEQERIRKTLESYVGVFADSEIIVVLNGCTDRTREVVESAIADSKNVSVIDIPDAVGKGGAVRAGGGLFDAVLELVVDRPRVDRVDPDGARS